MNRCSRYLVSIVIKFVVASAVLVGPATIAVAHEVPTDVVIQAFVKPTGQRLEFLVRVPLEAMRDVNFPESGPGYLVISDADETLQDAATIWVAQEVSFYENDTPLDQWSIEAVR
ncbi:MAG: hypothetical protein ACKVJN_12285, partial [Woeseiales bacterium]